MFGRRPEAPPSAAQRLSLFVQRAAAEYECEKEELETLQVLFRGAAAFAADCESRALQRGSHAADAFRLIGQATQVVGVGAGKVSAALPPPNPAALRALGELIGTDRCVVTEVADDTPADR